MNQAQRVLEILKLLKTQEICTHKLSEHFETDKRTIQRDIKILKEFLEDELISTKKGYYKVLNHSCIQALISEQKETKELKEFFEFIALFDDKTLEIFDADEFSFIKQIKKETNRLYHICENPIEKLTLNKMLEDIKNSIKYKRYIDLVYCEEKDRDFIDVKPLKIVYAKGNWYLASITKNYKTNNGFKFFRINFIKTILPKSQTFHRDISAEDFIKDFQSLFQSYSKPKYEVKIEVDKTVKRHFHVKKHLSSQKKIDEIDGNLILSYNINDDMEIIPIIKAWMPYLKVISPISLKNKIEKDIKKYLSD